MSWDIPKTFEKRGYTLSRKERDLFTKPFTPEHYFYLDEHDLNPYERKADVNALRYLFKRNGLYDPKTGKFKNDEGKDVDFNKELLNKFKNNFYINRLKSIYEDDEIVDLVNTVAYNNGRNQNNYV